MKYIKKQAFGAILAPLFKLLEACFDLMVPLVVAAIIDIGIKGGAGTPYIIKMSIVLVALAFIGFTMAVIAQYFAAKASVRFATDVRSALFKKFQELSYSQIDKFGTSSMITRMTSDVNQLQSGTNLALRLFLRAPIIVFGSAIMAFSIDSKSALTFVVAIPLLCIAVFGVMLLTMPLYKKAQMGTDKILKKTRENLTGARVIRAFANEGKEIAEFDSDNNSLTSIQKIVGRISAVMNPVTYLIVNAAIIALVYIGSKQVDDGVILQGSVVALYNYMSQILIELIKLANLIVSVSKAVACGNRIGDVLNGKSIVTDTIENDPAAPQESSGAFISFKNVSVKYSKESDESLSDVSFDVKRGETIGIIGGTGSGKTTLVNLIPALYRVSSGAVYLSGTNVNSIDKRTILEKIGIVPQKAVLFKGSIRENIKWGNENASDEEIMKAIEIAQASDVVNEKGGLDYEIEQDARNLSGGQKQRLTIARALVKDPEILILDDSASALDFATDAALRQAIKKLETTVFIVSQRASSVMFADKIIVLDDGKAVSIGNHDELIKTSEEYKEIYYSQYPEEMEAAV